MKKEKIYPVEVKDCRAIYDAQTHGKMVCGNPFKIEFTFDEEWNAYANVAKKAKIKFWLNGRYEHINIEFRGNICPVPALYNIPRIEVGVFIDDDICTTTGAIIECEKSINCGASKSVLGADAIDNINKALLAMVGQGGGGGGSGADGENGVGIAQIINTSTIGLVDTYTIYYTDGTTSTYTVTNGADGHSPVITIQDGYWYIDGVNTNVKAQGNDSNYARIGEVTLTSSGWNGSGNLYSQVVNIDGVTENTQVDLTPSVQQLAAFYEKDIAFVTENEDGVVTVYCIGQKPQNDYTIQVTMTEVLV